MSRLVSWLALLALAVACKSPREADTIASLQWQDVLAIEMHDSERIEPGLHHERMVPITGDDLLRLRDTAGRLEPGTYVSGEMMLFTGIDSGRLVTTKGTFRLFVGQVKQASRHLQIRIEPLAAVEPPAGTMMPCYTVAHPRSFAASNLLGRLVRDNRHRVEPTVVDNRLSAMLERAIEAARTDR